MFLFCIVLFKWISPTTTIATTVLLLLLLLEREKYDEDGWWAIQAVNGIYIETDWLINCLYTITKQHTFDFTNNNNNKEYYWMNELIEGNINKKRERVNEF